MPDETTNQTEDSNKKISSLRTFHGDIADYVKKKEMSLVEIAAEEEKRKGEIVIREESSISFKKIIIAIIVVVVITGAGAGLYFYYKGQRPEPLPQPSFRPLIISEGQKEVGVSQNFLNDLKDALKTEIKINSLLYIPVATEPEKFFKLIGSSPPLDLFYSVDKNFMLSKFCFSQDWPILLFKVKSYEYAFGSMVRWEKGIYNDLKELFSLKEITPVNNVFLDKEIQNHDVRVLADEAGNMVLAYSFFNREYLIITTGEESLKEMYRRLSSSQYLNQ